MTSVDPHETEGIIITIGQSMIKEKGYRNWLRNFLRAMASETGTTYWMRLGAVPKREILYVYLCIGGKVRYRSNFVMSDTNREIMFDDGHSMWAKAWVVMAGPVSEFVWDDGSGDLVGSFHDWKPEWKPKMTYTCHHNPSDEDWVVLFVDQKRRKVYPAGWPSTIADLTDCVQFKERALLTEEEIKFLSEKHGISFEEKKDDAMQPDLELLLATASALEFHCQQSKGHDNTALLKELRKHKRTIEMMRNWSKL